MGEKSDDIKALREHVDSWFAAHTKEHELISMALVLAREVNEKDLDRTRQAMEKRLEGMNEFRAQLTDAASTFATRNDLRGLGKEFEAKLEGIDKQIGALSKLVWMASGVVLFIAMFASLIMYFLKKG